MRILVCEYLCSGAAADLPGAESLRREGLAMFRAIVEDLAFCPDVQILAPLDAAMGNANPLWPANLVATPVSGPAEERVVFDRLARQADAALVIAPEFDDLFRQRAHRLEELGIPLLGCSSEAIRLTADKWGLAQRWQQAGVPTAPTSLLALSSSPDFPCVLKPRYGAGSQATFLLRDREALRAALEQARAEGPVGEMVWQPFQPGRPASVAFLLGPHGELALPAAWQVLSQDDRFHYLGGELPLPSDLTRRAQRLARQAIQVVPGLRGYVGLDLILGDSDDGSGDRAIEINPRLTTSYVGLRALARGNLAATLLGLLGWGPRLPEPVWDSGPVVFRADGRVTIGDPLSSSAKTPIIPPG